MSTRAIARSVGPACAIPSPRAGPTQRPIPTSSRPRGASGVALSITKSYDKPSSGILRTSVKIRPIHATKAPRTPKPPVCSAAKGPPGPAAPGSYGASSGTGSMASTVLALATEANQVSCGVQAPAAKQPYHVCMPLCSALQRCLGGALS
jgi:hypothetical protein